jgi:hypothetical protein
MADSVLGREAETTCVLVLQAVHGGQSLVPTRRRSRRKRIPVRKVQFCDGPRLPS